MLAVRRCTCDHAGGAPILQAAEYAAAPDGATRERHAAQPEDPARLDRLLRAEGFDFGGAACWDGGILWAVPLTTDASAAVKPVGAGRLIQLCCVLFLRPRRQARAASSASCSIGAPPAWPPGAPPADQHYSARMATYTIGSCGFCSNSEPDPVHAVLVAGLWVAASWVIGNMRGEQSRLHMEIHGTNSSEDHPR